MKEAWWKYKAPKIEMPWWKLVVIFLAILIVLAYKVAYRDLVYKKQMPIDSMKFDWQLLHSSTAMMFGGESYAGDVYFDRLGLEKKENKVTLWIKAITHRPVIGKGTENFTWDEQVARWIVDCEAKEVKVNHMTFFLQGKKQYGGKIDDLRFPIAKGTTSYTIYEMFCF